jgi:hypothetical protein
MKTYLTLFDKEATQMCASESDAEKIAKTLLTTLPQRAGGRFIVGLNLQTRYLSKP